MPKTLSTITSSILSITVGLVAITLCYQPARSQEPTTTLVLFDGSGSMWGKLKGGAETKFQIAVRSLTNAYSAQPNPKSSPGLIVFGGRCTSAKLKAPPAGPNAIQQFNDQLARLNPKGKGPISLGIENAAKALPKQSDASVILIHDGPDNCRRDPCLAAQDFAKTHKGIPIHLVSIALPKAARIATACVAKLTGGTVTQVETSEQLDAALTQAVKLTMKTPEVKKEDSKSAQTNEDNVDTDAAKDKIGPSRIRLFAKLGAKGKKLKTPVRWQVFKSKNGAQDPTPLLDTAEAQLTLPVKSDTYLVTATLGRMAQSHEVTVPKIGAAVLEVVFDAGQVRLRAPKLQQSDALSTPTDRSHTIVTLSRIDANNVQPSENSATATTNPIVAPIVVADGGESVAILPTGKYRITTEKGLARSQQSIVITPGTTSQIDLNLGTGQLIIDTLVPGDADMPTTTLLKIFIDDPDTPTGRREIARTTAQNPSFTLQAGTYYISAQVDYAQQKARAVVTSGGTTMVKFELPAAYLSLKTNLDISNQRSKLPVQYRIFSLTDANQEIAQSGRQHPNFVLSPGKYRIVAEIGARNVSATAEVDLPAGSKTEVKLNPPAAHVSLKLGGADNASSINRFWVVRDQSGAVVWRTNAYAPSALLAPGSYEVSCETRNGERKKSFKLVAGESKSIVLTN